MRVAVYAFGMMMFELSSHEATWVRFRFRFRFRFRSSLGLHFGLYTD